MHRIIEIKPLENFKVWLKFSDGVEGTIDLSDIAGKGVFASFNDPKYFHAVFIDPATHTLAWPGGIDLCPDSLYTEITGVEIHSQLTHA
ncbi:MAG: hypothetical protein A2X59_02535 [Nitrospirae bacterium GWC2_42_7]|nr:MAG: hypothetical protein A2X59_02535 [Nitrospirae bacterium GWC2_42_7]